MKIFICILLISSGGLLGRFFAKRYSKKEKFCRDCLNYATAYSANMTYRMEEIDVFSQNGEYGEEFNQALKYYLFAGEKPKDRLLSDKDNDYVANFFNLLGKSDSLSQQKQIVYYIDFFKSKLEEYRTERTQKSPMCLKLGLICGFLAGILII